MDKTFLNFRLKAWLITFCIFGTILLLVFSPIWVLGGVIIFGVLWSLAFLIDGIIDIIDDKEE